MSVIYDSLEMDESFFCNIFDCDFGRED